MASKPEVVYRAQRFHIERRALTRRGGGSAYREVIVHPGSVVILPLLDDGRVVLIKNERVSIGRELWELPAGTREPNEDPALCAARELEEETGYRAQALVPLFSFYLTPGISDERMHAYVARGLTKTQQALDPTEQIEPVPTLLDEVLRMIKMGEIEDAKTLATMLFWMAR
jgi:ADP-ribose pyrophosphatase